jgi:glycerol-1-phosphatase
MVAALRAATDSKPQVAGKPEPTLLTDALARGKFRTPLVIGDRLDTDIAGARGVGWDSLLVLTGISTRADVREQPPSLHPTFVGDDLRALFAAD